jgi:phosphate acetyltransferase
MNVVPAGSSETQSHSKYDRLIAAAKAVPPVPTIVVVSPCDETSLRGVVDRSLSGSLLALMNSEKSFGPAAHLLTRSI